jgi:hypothetical protein
MNLRPLFLIVVALVLTASSVAQDANPAPASGQNPEFRHRAGMGGGMGAGLAGRGVEGSVTEATADHFTIKTYAGESYTVHYSANTRFMKQPAGMGQGQNQGQNQGQGASQNAGQGRGQGNYQNNPGGAGGGMRAQLQIKATDIKVGDAIAATGEIDATAKSVGAVMVMQIDPARAKELQQLEANYGKTWLQGKVTAINEVKVTILGVIDNAPHTFLADENTVFRKMREPVTLADIQVGDSIRVEGASANGAFTATTVNVMPTPSDATTQMPRRPRPQ